MLKTIVGALAALPLLAMAQAYPSKPIRLVVPFPPGGTTDIVARTISDRLSQRLGQPVIIDNRPGGAGGSVGTVEITRAAPDGYTLGMATVGTLGTSPAVNRKIGYDPLKDVTYLTNIAAAPMVIAVGPKVKASGINEFIAQAKQVPDRFSYASSGSGGVAHMMGELFKLTTDTRMVHIPYRGAAPALTDAAAGQVEAVFDTLVSSMPFIRSGQVRALAVSGDQRTPTLPDVPTFREVGLAPVSSEVWYGLIGPARLPDEVVQKIYDAMKAVLAMPEVVERLRGQGAEPVANSPAQFRKQVEVETAKWKHTATVQKITLD